MSSESFSEKRLVMKDPTGEKKHDGQILVQSSPFGMDLQNKTEEKENNNPTQIIPISSEVEIKKNKKGGKNKKEQEKRNWFGGIPHHHLNIDDDMDLEDLDLEDMDLEDMDLGFGTSPIITVGKEDSLDVSRNKKVKDATLDEDSLGAFDDFIDEFQDDIVLEEGSTEKEKSRVSTATKNDSLVSTEKKKKNKEDVPDSEMQVKDVSPDNDLDSEFDDCFDDLDPDGIGIGIGMDLSSPRKGINEGPRKEETDATSFGSFDGFGDEYNDSGEKNLVDDFNSSLRDTLEELKTKKKSESKQNWNVGSLQPSKETNKVNVEFGDVVKMKLTSEDDNLQSKDGELDESFAKDSSLEKSDGVFSLKLSDDEQNLSKEEIGSWDLDLDVSQEPKEELKTPKTPEDYVKSGKKVSEHRTTTKSLPKKNRKKFQKKKKGISKKELRRRNKQRLKYFFGWFVEEFADTEIRMKKISIKCFKSFLIGSNVRLDRVIKLDKSLQIDQVVFLKLLSGHAEASLIPKKDLFDYYCLFDFLKMPECMYLICKEVEKVGSTKLLIYLFVKCRGQFETHLNFIRRDYSVESLLEEERPARKDKVKFHSAFSLAVYTMLKAREMQIRRSNALVTYFVKLELLFLLELGFNLQPIESYFKISFTKSFKELFRRNLLVLMKNPRKYGNFAVTSADNVTFKDRHLEVLILKSNFFFDIVEKGKISSERSGKKKKKRSANPLFHLGKVVLAGSSSIKLTKSEDNFMQHLKKMRGVQLQLQSSHCVGAYLEYVYSGRITNKTSISGLCELNSIIKLHGGENKLQKIVDKRLATKMNSLSKSDAATTIYDEVMRTMKILFNVE